MKIDILLDSKDVKIITIDEIIFEYYGKEMKIQPGYVSDGCSIPRFLWSLISPQIHPETLEQSIKHDYLFQNKLGFFKSNWYYFKDLKGGLNLFKRILVLIGVTLRWLDTLFLLKESRLI